MQMFAVFILRNNLNKFDYNDPILGNLTVFILSERNNYLSSIAMKVGRFSRSIIIVLFILGQIRHRKDYSICDSGTRSD